MVFSSQIFLFFFLPVTFIGYMLCRRLRSKNLWLLFMSVFFYAYGAGKVVFILAFSVFVNWAIALLITRTKREAARKALVALDVLLNLSYLFYYKYFNFAQENFNLLTGRTAEIVEIALPIGISFFTFQALSYCIDVYRDSSLVQKNIINVALYITFFPQLIAGPIVRFTTVAKEINDRHVTAEDFTSGVERFVIGLGKKVLIANIVATMVDNIYAMDQSEISVATAWLASLGYALQIYFDFSGYSDMAIGLGRMFGFHFLENFNYPYVSRSISEFWRRWHISLSMWFRDYIYIPLGGNRCSFKRQIFNLSMVWLCTGIWHGANWTFIMWGVIYGIIVILEKLVHFEQMKLPSALKHVYTLLIVNFLWVLFRADNIGVACGMIKIMLGLSGNPLADGTAAFYLNENLTVILIGLAASLPIVKTASSKLGSSKAAPYARALWICMILIISISYMIKGAYNPFIYFNF